MDADNPWQVESIEAFYFLKCPECMFFTKEDKGFYHHAVKNHPLSIILFGKPAQSKELLAQEGISFENLNFQLNCDRELLLSDTNHLKKIEKETEIVKTDLEVINNSKDDVLNEELPPTLCFVVESLFKVNSPSHRRVSTKIVHKIHLRRL